MNFPWTRPKNLTDAEYETFKECSSTLRFIIWIIVDVSEIVGYRILDFLRGFTYFRIAFDTWYAIMTTDYEISSQKYHTLSWFDSFYIELDRREDYWTDD